ncbi:MAG TPA: glycosyltransferase family 39 protein [Acidimicrobiia bacterium]|nr:glycosyltransferase family 39 protein [Acidimicrobiia bacterium]
MTTLTHDMQPTVGTDGGVVAMSRPSPGAPLPRLAVPSVVLLAVTKVTFQLVTASLYGAHRDEFYYLAGGHHLAWGYVDHPPAVPALDRLAELVLGHSVVALHVLPALIGGVLVLLGALLARELGGGTRAQTLAAVVAAIGPLYLTTTHFLSTVTLDLVVWALASLLVIRMIRTGDARWWLAIGAVVGLGLLNKYTVAFWVLGAVGGLLCTGRRRLLSNRWALGGACIAAALVAPNVAWQASHHWATFEFMRNLRANNGATNVREFLPLQLVAMTLAGTVVWVAALRATVRRTSFDVHRWLAVGWLILFVVLFATEGKGYYLGSWYLPLVALGAVVIERTWSARAQRVLFAAVVVTGLAMAPLFTPILPERTFVAAGLNDTNKDLGSLIGWPRVVHQVADVVHTLPTDEQRRSVILTSNYSEAGALEFWRPELRLPDVISGDNTYWWWGYGHRHTGPVVTVGFSRQFLARYWDNCTPAGTLGRGAPIDPQEVGASIFVCRGQRITWARLWPRLRDYG